MSLVKYLMLHLEHLGQEIQETRVGLLILEQMKKCMHKGNEEWMVELFKYWFVVIEAKEYGGNNFLLAEQYLWLGDHFIYN